MKHLKTLYFRYFVSPDLFIIDKLKELHKTKLKGSWLTMNYELIGNTYFIFMYSIYQKGIEAELGKIILDFMDIYSCQDVHICFLDENSLTRLKKPTQIL